MWYKFSEPFPKSGTVSEKHKNRTNHHYNLNNLNIQVGGKTK